MLLATFLGRATRVAIRVPRGTQRRHMVPRVAHTQNFTRPHTLGIDGSTKLLPKVRIDVSKFDCFQYVDPEAPGSGRIVLDW